MNIHCIFILHLLATNSNAHVQCTMYMHIYNVHCTIMYNGVQVGVNCVSQYNGVLQVDVKHVLQVIPVPYPLYTWCKPRSEHTYDTLRAEEAYIPNRYIVTCVTDLPVTVLLPIPFTVFATVSTYCSTFYNNRSLIVTVSSIITVH